MAYREALIQGASRGIGLALVEALLERAGVERVWATARHPEQSVGLMALQLEYGERLKLLAIDVTREETIEAAAAEVKHHTDVLHLVINAAGVLHDEASGMKPERALRDLNPEHLARSFAVNATGPILMAKHFHGFLKHQERAVWANLSARVGSIGDNELGGWYGYRASKAAQNQLTRTLAIELKRRAPNAICVALHPGTVATDLSAPFRANVPPDKLFTTARAAHQLLEVLDRRSVSETGTFWDWAGEPVAW